MTIVVATAGSTLGALVVLLTALVCFRRFHRSRRFRHSAFRSRRYSDDDRIAIIAAYTGDVHFILPSYDEAMSQVQSSPPSFESVVENRQEGRNQIASNANSQSVDTNERNIPANGTDDASEVSRPAASVPEGGPSTGEERLINIVNNPLADSSRESSETTGINHSDNVLLPVEDRIADDDSSPQEGQVLHKASFGFPPLRILPYRKYITITSQRYFGFLIKFSSCRSQTIIFKLAFRTRYIFVVV